MRHLALERRRRFLPQGAHGVLRGRHCPTAVPARYLGRVRYAPPCGEPGDRSWRPRASPPRPPPWLKPCSSISRRVMAVCPVEFGRAVARFAEEDQPCACEPIEHPAERRIVEVRERLRVARSLPRYGLPGLVGSAVPLTLAARSSCRSLRESERAEGALGSVSFLPLAVFRARPHRPRSHLTQRRSRR